jgi:hypothetical protein
MPSKTPVFIRSQPQLSRVAISECLCSESHDRPGTLPVQVRGAVAHTPTSCFTIFSTLATAWAAVSLPA